LKKSQKNGEVKTVIGNVRFYNSDSRWWISDKEVDGENVLKLEGNSNLPVEYGNVHASELSVAHDGTLWGVLQAFSDSYSKSVLALFNREEKNWYAVNANAGNGVKDVTALNKDVVAYSDWGSNVYISDGIGVQEVVSLTSLPDTESVNKL